MDNKNEPETKETVEKTNIKLKKKNKKKGFTLIELLAVIIILGVLMIIAIPSVTTYISNSRKNAYIDTAKNIIGGARNIVNEGKLEMFDTNSMYYLPTSCIGTENGSESPYGKFTVAYVGVIYNGDGYKYYWISNDSAGQGIDNITLEDKLDIELIKSNLTDLEIQEKVDKTGVGNREQILILQDDCKTWNNALPVEDHINEDGSQVKTSYLYFTEDTLITLGNTITEVEGGYSIKSTGIWNGEPYEYEDVVEHVYKTYQEAINSRGYNFFIRLKLVNDVIEGIDIGYYRNNQVYYVKGLTPSSYESNKNTLMSSFESQYCSEGTSSTGCDYNGNECTGIKYNYVCYVPGNPGLFIHVYDNGEIDAFDNIGGNSEWSCMVYNDYSRCTIPY